MPQMRCFAPSMRPPIEPVVSRTKTISKVLSSFFSLTGGSCGGRLALVFGRAEAMMTPTTKVRTAVESLNRLRFMFVSLSTNLAGRLGGQIFLRVERRAVGTLAETNRGRQPRTSAWRKARGERPVAWRKARAKWLELM